MKVILVGINLEHNSLFEEGMQECIRLCEACGMEVMDTVYQQARTLDKHTAVRSGKIEEIRQKVEVNEANAVVFYNNLTVGMVSRLGKALQCEVIDRTTLILDIFSLRAQTREAKLQIQLARLQYLLPRTVADEVDQEHATGGAFRNRGSGESRSALQKRKITHHIHEIKEELKQVEEHRDSQKKQQLKSGLGKVALVGYTNAGKSSLMNTLLEMNHKEDKLVLQKDQLFATLDTSVRKITYKGKAFLLYDTVGFVSDLPHELIEAFKSTLDAARDADLLVIVNDISDEHHESQLQITQDTLKEIHADTIDQIVVYNKCDLIEEHEGLMISCKDKTGIDDLLETIFNHLYPKEKQLKVLLPYNQMKLLNDYSEMIDFELLEHTNEGSIYSLSGSVNILKNFEKYCLQSAESLL